MATESEIKAVNKFNKEKTKCVNVRLNLKTDADILKKLDNVPSKMGYIKEIIRKDIAENDNGNVGVHFDGTEYRA